MITNRDRLAVVEAFYVSTDLGQDTTEPVADGDDTSSIKLRWFDVKEVIDAVVGHLSLKNVERSQLARLFDAQPALYEQFQEGPIPARIHLVSPRVTASGCDLRRCERSFPSLKSEDANLRHLAL